MARDKSHQTDLQLTHWVKPGGEGLTFMLSAAGVAGWILRYREGKGPCTSAKLCHPGPIVPLPLPA